MQIWICVAQSVGNISKAKLRHLFIAFVRSIPDASATFTVELGLILEDVPSTGG